MLWVTQDHPFCTDILHHGGAEGTSEGTLCLLVAILQHVVLDKKKIENGRKASSSDLSCHGETFWQPPLDIVQIHSWDPDDHICVGVERGGVEMRDHAVDRGLCVGVTQNILVYRNVQGSAKRLRPGLVNMR